MSALVKVLRSYQHRTQLIKNLTWRFFPKSSDLEIVFVVGAPRSGTTLMHRILSCHSRFFAIDQETGFFSKSNYFNLDHFALGAPDWPLVVDQASGPGEYFGNAIEVIREREHVVDGIFVEKTPQHVLCLKQLLRIFSSAKVIHIIRDGRDCYRSSKAHPSIPQRKSADCFANYWKSCLAARASCGDDPRIHDVRYEDLAQQPEEELSALMTFLGEKLEPGQLDPSSLASDKRSDRQVFERLKEPISPKTVGQWKRDLTKEEVDVFERIAAERLVKWSYV